MNVSRSNHRHGVSHSGRAGKLNNNGVDSHKKSRTVMSDNDNNDVQQHEPSTSVVKSTVVVCVPSTVNKAEVPSSLSKDVSLPRKKSLTSAGNKRLLGSLLLGTLAASVAEDQKGMKERKENMEKIEQRLRESEAKQTAEREANKLLASKEREMRIAEAKRRKEEEALRYREESFTEMSAQSEIRRKQLGHFIRTKTEPHIFFSPKKHMASTMALLAETRTHLLEEHINKIDKLRKEMLTSVTEKTADVNMVDDSETASLAEKEGANEEPEGPPSSVGMAPMEDVPSDSISGVSEIK